MMEDLYGQGQWLCLLALPDKFCYRSQALFLCTYIILMKFYHQFYGDISYYALK